MSHRRADEAAWAKMMSEGIKSARVPAAAAAGTVANDLFTGLAYYYLTGIVVLIGVFFGSEFTVKRGTARTPPDLVSDCIRFDGWNYLAIAQNGYDYDPAKRSMVAFFPAYPLLVRWLSLIAGVRTEDSLLLVSNAFLVLAYGLLAGYARLRADPAYPSQVGWTLLVFGLWPSTFFFRMALAESVFAATAVLALIAIERRWPLPLAALAAGLATATRPVGVAVTAAFLWHVLFYTPGRIGSRCLRAAVLAPLACWGLLAYMAYQHVEFGNALAFAQTQENWTYAAPVKHPTITEKALSLVTLEPIRGVFDPSSPRFMGRWNAAAGVLFNLFFWNPVMFVVSAVLVTYGAWRKWLTGPEVVLGAALVAIPYLTRAYEMSMASHARFAAAVVVIYPVLGRVLASCPAAASAAVCSLSAVLMMCWKALYTAGHSLF